MERVQLDANRAARPHRIARLVKRLHADDQPVDAGTFIKVGPSRAIFEDLNTCREPRCLVRRQGQRLRFSGPAACRREGCSHTCPDGEQNDPALGNSPRVANLTSAIRHDAREYPREKNGVNRCRPSFERQTDS